MVYRNGRDVLKQFLEKYEKRKSFENIRDMASIIGTEEGYYQKT